MMKFLALYLFSPVLLANMLPADGWIHNEYWSIDPRQQCWGDYHTVSYSEQSVGVLNFAGETARITIDIPPGATKASWASKSHAPKPSVEMSLTSYEGVCWDANQEACPANKLPITVHGAGDNLAPVNKSYVDKTISPLNNADKIYVYWTNMGENFGTSSMYSASITFYLTDKACAQRAGETPPPVGPYVNWIDHSINWLRLGDVKVETQPGLIQQCWFSMSMHNLYDWACQ
jgi:hypothetical protein